MLGYPGSRVLLKTKEDFGHVITEELVSPGYGPPNEHQISECLAKRNIEYSVKHEFQNKNKHMCM